jgi:hypothetical protein
MRNDLVEYWDILAQPGNLQLLEEAFGNDDFVLRFGSLFRDTLMLPDWLIEGVYSSWIPNRDPSCTSLIASILVRTLGKRKLVARLVCELQAKKSELLALAVFRAREASYFVPRPHEVVAAKADMEAYQYHIATPALTLFRPKSGILDRLRVFAKQILYNNPHEEMDMLGRQGVINQAQKQAKQLAGVSDDDLKLYMLYYELLENGTNSAQRG